MKSVTETFWRVAVSCAVAVLSLDNGNRASGIEQPFPVASPESVGLDPQALEDLAEMVQAYFEEGDIAGAELLVIKSRRTVLHRAIGWKDADARTPLECGTIFNIRSMTKPMTGTLAQMLIDEQALTPDDTAARYLDVFTHEPLRAVRVDHLLTHTSGLPLTCIDRPLRDYTDLDALAYQVGTAGLDFSPGSNFAYSDSGTDCLAAILQKASGLSLGELFQYRLFEPLMMRDSFATLSATNELAERVSSNHVGLKGSWSRFWRPGDEPLYPFPMGSQSVYTTAIDYAKFLALWMDDGAADGRRLLSEAAIKRGLEPVSIMNYATGLPGLTLHYGRMWMLWLNEAKELVAFGHGGSDGTYAVAFPEQDLMVLYLTQSRGQQTIPRFEQALSVLLLDANPDRIAQLKSKMAPDQLRPYLGLYRGDGSDLYSAIVVQDGKLAVELVGNQVLVLEPDTLPDDWRLQALPTQKLTFRRSANGAVTGIDITGPLINQSVLRLQPSEDLPDADTLMQRKRTAHGTEHFEALGTFRLSGHYSLEKRNIKGTVSDLYRGADHRKLSIDLGELGTQLLGFTPQHVWSTTSLKSELLSGALAEQARLGSLGSLLADWRRDYQEIHVLYRLKVAEEECLVVRTVPHFAPASTKYVSIKSGLLLAEDRITLQPGVGMLGTFVVYEDYRNIDGVQIPFRIRSRTAHPLVGTTIVQYDHIDTHLETPVDVFEFPGDQ